MRYLFPLSPWNQQRQFEKPVWVYPAHLAMYATYLRNGAHYVEWREAKKEELYPFPTKFDVVIKDDFQIDVPFEKLPYPDRVFTKAKDPRWLTYGNYKFYPGSHIMSSNLCWWAGERGCVFCIDSKKIIDGEKRGVRPVSHVMAEIENCVSLGFKELFDDAGTIPINEWLNNLCHEMIKSGLNKKIVLGCNLKPIKQDFKLMKKAGFRFILVGVESANQSTIDRIQKGQKCDKVIENLKAMSEAGLEPHTTWMSNFSWETKDEENKSIELCNFLLRKGYSKTAQASVYSAPRTRPDPLSEGHKRIPLYFNAYKHPEFWYNRIKDIKKWQDFTYLMRGGRLVLEEHWRKFWKK